MLSASVTIDAGVLAVPPLHGTEVDTHRYIQALLDWAKLLDEPWVAICMSERSSEILFADDLYPLRDQLKQLFNQHGIEEYDVNTVATVVDRLLMHTPSFETYFRVGDVLSENLSTTPDVLQLCPSQALREDLARCLVLIAILRKHCGADVLDNALILRRSPDRTIHVRALVHELEHQRQDFGSPVPKPPDYFEGDVFVCDDFRGLLACIDDSTVLRSATDDAGVEIAIRIALYKCRLARGLEPDWDDVGRMRLGDSFGASLRACCRSGPPSVAASALRATCDAIEGHNLRAIHALRTKPGGNAPQRLRRRDKAKAWRRDVDREYHLHYWGTEDGGVELASLGVHNDFDIPE